MCAREPASFWREKRGLQTTTSFSGNVIVTEISYLGLDTNIKKNRLNLFSEIPDFFVNISKIFSKYLENVLNIPKNIWLHFINITVTTQKNSQSSNMATQISAILLNISHIACIINGEYY